MVRHERVCTFENLGYIPTSQKRWKRSTVSCFVTQFPSAFQDHGQLAELYFPVDGEEQQIKAQDIWHPLHPADVFPSGSLPGLTHLLQLRKPVKSPLLASDRFTRSPNINCQHHHFHREINIQLLQPYVGPWAPCVFATLSHRVPRLIAGNSRCHRCGFDR